MPGRLCGRDAATGIGTVVMAIAANEVLLALSAWVCGDRPENEFVDRGDAFSGSDSLFGQNVEVRSTLLPFEDFFLRRPNFFRSFFTFGEYASPANCNYILECKFYNVARTLN